MPRVHDLIAAVATTIGLRPEEVVQIARNLREHDLFVRETKSPRSWKLSPQDAANLLASILSGCPAVRAAEAIKRMSDCCLNSESLKHLRQSVHGGRVPYPETAIDGLDTNIVDAIAAIIRWFINSDQSTQNEFSGTFISYEMFGNTGEIFLWYMSPGGYSISLDYISSSRSFDCDLAQTRQLTAKTIAAVAGLFRGQS